MKSTLSVASLGFFLGSAYAHSIFQVRSSSHDLNSVELIKDLGTLGKRCCPRSQRGYPSPKLQWGACRIHNINHSPFIATYVQQPITDVTSNDVICNGGINPFLQPMSQAIINVPAGASVTAEWHHGGSGPDPNDASDPIDPSHKGPIIAYLYVV